MILNLQKNDILDLTKKDPTLNRLMLGAGWDINTKQSGFFGGLFGGGFDYDLDLFAIKLDENSNPLNDCLVYFGKKNHPGILLHGDNLTGEGDGDDEKISINLSQLPINCHRVVFGVAIYQADVRRQGFGDVKNAYIRLMNEDKGMTEICRFNLTEDGGNHTALIACELTKVNGEWSFKAVETYHQGDISEIVKMYLNN